MLLSVLIPVYNERKTLATLIEIVCGVLPGVDKELIVVDDCSTDGTRDWLRGNFPDGARSATSVAVDASGNLALAQAQSGATVTIRALYHEHNKGKGGALQTALAAATGDVLVVQDADLEYDPQDYKQLVAPLLSGAADVVYGSRFKGSIERMRWLNRMGNIVMTGASRVLYGVNVSDLMTCYKMYRRSLIDGLHIRANGFDFEAEFTARLAQRGARFAEVPVSFYGRTFEEGKKIRAVDAVRVMRELVRCKLTGESRA
jgi:glycosyltransferase involved in cell wall biosynthesis